MKWIKCIERMPAIEQEVILYDQQGNFDIGCLTRDAISGNLYWTLHGWMKWNLDTQTHWQLLPEAPTKDIE